MSKFRVIDLFCGAGGLSAGFMPIDQDHGFQLILAIDNDVASIRTHNRMFGNHGVCADIEEWLAENEVPEADVVLGGPPCQGFSLLNKKRRTDARRALWEPYMDFVEKSRARVFVMENVPDLLKSMEFEQIKQRAEDLGFQMRFAKLNTADYGVAQVRRRAIIVGVRGGLGGPINFPPPETNTKVPTLEGLPGWVVVKDVIGDLDPPQGTEIRACPPPYNLHFGRNPTAKSKARYKLIPEGGNRFDLQRLAPELTPSCWIRKKSGGTDLFGRLWWDRPSVTIRTEFFKPEKGRYLHPCQDRPITHREAARIMGFPDDFFFEGSKLEVARQIGNAVPPPFARAIAGVVEQVLKSAVVCV